MDINATTVALIIPLALIELGLLVFALVDLIKREQVRGSKVLWALLICFLGIIGPVAYFIIGRKDE